MVSLGTICAQAVRTARKNTVEEFPHLPHLGVQNKATLKPVCTKPHSYAVLLPQQPTTKYTAKIKQITEWANVFSPVSTQPITTTTTYI